MSKGRQCGSPSCWKDAPKVRGYCEVCGRGWGKDGEVGMWCLRMVALLALPLCCILNTVHCRTEEVD